MDFNPSYQGFSDPSNANLGAAAARNGTDMLISKLRFVSDLPARRGMGENVRVISINGDRLLSDLRELAAIGKCETGVDRVAFSQADIAARRWLVRKLTAAGLDATLDRVGNVLGRAPNAAE